MAAIRELITRSELKTSRMKNSFSHKPHDFYVFYDKKTDELIVKLVDPKLPSSLYFIRDDLALIINPLTSEEIGFHLFGFEKCLEQHKEFSHLWEELNLADEFSSFTKIHYDPVPKVNATRKENIDAKTANQITELIVTCNKLDQVVPCYN